MPDTLVRKRSAKLQEYERMSKSDPRSASEGTRVRKAKIKKMISKSEASVLCLERAADGRASKIVRLGRIIIPL
jgi:hypothetical protein